MEKINLEERITQLVGEASMCWNPTPSGEFNSEKAVEIRDEIMSLIEKELKDKGAIY